MKTDLQEIFNKIDACLADKVYIQTIDEDENGSYKSEMETITEDTLMELGTLIDDLYNAIEVLR